MVGIFHGDLGTSYVSKLPVWEEIASRLPVTAKVAFFVIFFAVIIGAPVGILSAVRQYSIVDSLTRIAALVGITMPSFWLALRLVLLFSVNLKWLPASGLYGLEYYIMPILSISAVSMATITRTVGSSMLEVVRQDYIRTARSKGQRENVVYRRGHGSRGQRHRSSAPQGGVKRWAWSTKPARAKRPPRWASWG